MKKVVLDTLLIKWVMGFFYIDKVGSEEVIEYHKAGFGIIDGYYFNGGRNNTINRVSQDLYGLRKKLKQ